MSDLLLSFNEIIEQAKETVKDVVDVIPIELTPDQEEVFLINSGKILSMAARIIDRMVADKKPLTLN